MSIGTEGKGENALGEAGEWLGAGDEFTERYCKGDGGDDTAEGGGDEQSLQVFLQLALHSMTHDLNLYQQEKLHSSKLCSQMQFAASNTICNIQSMYLR